MSIKYKNEPPILGKMQRISQDSLEELFSYLSYAQVSAMGRECKSFREAARSILYRALEKIMSRIDIEIDNIEKLSKIQRKSTSGDHPPLEQIHFAALTTILKMCSSELRIINVCCARYMRDREFDFCFPAGDLLDDFDAVVAVVRQQLGEPEQRVNSDVTTSLFIKTGRFLDFFDATLETVVAREVPLGVTVLDILGCSQASDFVLELAHADGGACYRLTGRYELHDTGTVDRPPDLSVYPTPVKSKVLVRYLRNYVRWNNLFDSLHKLWDLEEGTLDENHNTVDKSADAAHLIDELASKRTAYQRRHISDTGDVCRDVFQGRNSNLETTLGITLNFTLSARDLPMCLESQRGTHIKMKESSLLQLDGPCRDACIQTELSYVETPKLDGDNFTEFQFVLGSDIDPDKVLDYVDSVKKSMTDVRSVVDKLSVTFGGRPTSSSNDVTSYRSAESFVNRRESELSFPYQCSAVSVDGALTIANSPRKRQLRGFPSHMSVVYHCSVQSLPRDSCKATSNFIASLARIDKLCVKRSNSAYKFVEKKCKNAEGRPATTNDMLENCILLEKLSNRCDSLVKRFGSDEDIFETVEKQSHEALKDDVLNTIHEQGLGELLDSKSFIQRQEVVPEFDTEVFKMQMKIQYVSDSNRLCEKIVTVDRVGDEIVIDNS